MRKNTEPTAEEMLDAIDQGIRNAQKDYLKAYMSDVASSYAPEYLTTVYVFQSILELIEKYGYTYGLALEHRFCELFPRKWHRLESHEQRSKGNYAWDYHKDLKRLIFLLGLGLKFGVFASCLFEQVKDRNVEKAKADLEETIQSLEREIKADLEETIQSLEREIKADYGKPSEKLSIKLVPYHINDKPLQFLGENSPEDDEYWVWCPVIFKIFKKGSNFYTF